MSSSMSRIAVRGSRRVQALDGRERVEQELRLDARLHRLQPRLERAPRELRALELACVEAREALRRAPPDSDSRP